MQWQLPQNQTEPPASLCKFFSQVKNRYIIVFTDFGKSGHVMPGEPIRRFNRLEQGDGRGDGVSKQNHHSLYMHVEHGLFMIFL